MSEPRPIASLSPTLLARKGGARPAMRSQLQSPLQFHEATARQLEEDLGWNDMGLDQDECPAPNVPYSGHTANVALLSGGTADAANAQTMVPQQQVVVAPKPFGPAKPRRAKDPPGHRVAMTLRIDVERHFKLRLASMMSTRSAQDIVTEALDRLLDEFPGLDSLAGHLQRG